MNFDMDLFREVALFPNVDLHFENQYFGVDVDLKL
jgi:hypothetical protein